MNSAQMMKQADRSNNTIWTIISIGFVLSLSMGFLDLTLGIFSKPSGLSSISLVLPPLAVSILFFFLIYLITWFFILYPIGSFLRLETVSLALSFVLFLVISYILGLVNILPSVYQPKDLIRLIVPIFSLAFVSFLIAIGGYFAIKSIVQRSSYKNALLVLSLTAPFVLAETMVFVWLQVYVNESFFSLRSWLFNIGYILTVLFTLGLFYRVGQPFAIMRLLTVLMIIVVLSPLMILVAMKDSKASLDGFEEANHQIKHVILITVDTLRPDILSCYGNERSVSTVHIDQLAKDGILFEEAISTAPWTLPSFASIMTGLSPAVHMTTKPSSKLLDNFKTLAEYMRDAGYYTAAIGYNLLLGPEFNISQGFLDYNFFPRSMGHTFGPLLLKLFSKKFFYPLLPDGTTDDLSRLVIDWLELNSEKDFFLWIHYYDPHGPYTPPAEYLPNEESRPPVGSSFGGLAEGIKTGLVPPLAERRWIKNLYNGEVRYVDENIGKLLNTLKGLDLYDESLIIFTSDHGEEFWEHGGVDHGDTLYNEVLWVPLIIKLPQSTSKGQITTAVSTQSITPTILDLTGIDYKDYLSADSLSPLWGLNPNGLTGRPLISTGLLYGEDMESVIFDGMKYIRSLVTNREELYDLTIDPGETVSVLHSFPDKGHIARNILREHHETARGLRESYRIVHVEKVRLDDETTEKLKALGYIQ